MTTQQKTQQQTKKEKPKATRTYKCGSCGGLYIKGLYQDSQQQNEFDPDPVDSGPVVLKIPGPSSSHDIGVLLAEAFDATKHAGRKRYVQHRETCLRRQESAKKTGVPTPEQKLQIEASRALLIEHARCIDEACTAKSARFLVFVLLSVMEGKKLFMPEDFKQLVAKIDAVIAGQDWAKPLGSVLRRTKPEQRGHLSNWVGLVGTLTEFEARPKPVPVDPVKPGEKPAHPPFPAVLVDDAMRFATARKATKRPLASVAEGINGSAYSLMEFEACRSLSLTPAQIRKAFEFVGLVVDLQLETRLKQLEEEAANRETPLEGPAKPPEFKQAVAPAPATAPAAAPAPTPETSAKLDAPAWELSELAKAFVQRMRGKKLTTQEGLAVGKEIKEAFEDGKISADEREFLRAEYGIALGKSSSAKAIEATRARET